MVRVLVARALASLRDGTERDDFPSERIMLWGKTDGKVRTRDLKLDGCSEVIETTVNGKEYWWVARTTRHFSACKRSVCHRLLL
jgi:hypothetical protein